MRGDRTMTGGVLLVDKPEGISSARVVSIVKRVLGRPKIGHLGTLDPFASGLLPLCVGEGTKLAPYLNAADKRYRGLIRLGITTDTLDRTGQVVSSSPAPDSATLDLDELACSMTGPQQQVPPAYSAIKRDGVPYYERARKGAAEEPAARSIVVFELALAAEGPDLLRLDIHCSKGTYVRSVARDLGRRIGCGGVLEELVRTAFGPFELGQALSLEDLEGDDGALAAERALIAPARAISHLPSVNVDRDTAEGLRAGRQATLRRVVAPRGDAGPVRVLSERDELVAVIIADGPSWKLERVFRSEASCGA